jgi:ParB/RepB/Spo0J family partition protein
MIEPVIVRPDGKGYKLVVGHRRRRAAAKAGLKAIPCIVRKDLDDIDVMRMQAVEDAQNEDLDPRDRYAFWARLWKLEKGANPKITMATFAEEIIGKGASYVRAGIDVAENAPEELREMLGDPDEGKLNPSYARYLVADQSLAPKEKVAVGKKIARGILPASGGRIGTETLKVIRTAPPKIRKRLIDDPEYSLEEASWELRHQERQQRVARVKEERTLTASELSMKLLHSILDFDVKLDPRIAPFIPDRAWDEISVRLRNLSDRIQDFERAHAEPAPAGEELIDAIDVKTLDALLDQPEP